MANRITQTANVQMDLGWRQRLAKERAISGRPPPIPDPFAHSLSSLISHEQPGDGDSQDPPPRTAGSGTGSRVAAGVGSVAGSVAKSAGMSARELRQPVRMCSSWY